MLDQIKQVDPTTNPTMPGKMGWNINDEDMVAIEKKADELVAGAEACTIDKCYVMNSLKGHTIVNKTLERFECNSFTMPCPEACAHRPSI